MPHRPVSKDIKARIPILFHVQGRSREEIQEILGIGCTLVYDTLRNQRHYGVHYNPLAHRPGCPRIVRSSDAHFVVRLLQNRRTLYLDEIQTSCTPVLVFNVTKSTILHTIRRLYFSHKCVSTKAQEANNLLRSHHMITIANIAPYPDMLMFTDEALA
ncbi:hypothetical protein D9758_012306 [Tetrapyrgos nigripes]|uniref:Uncharacterized protein n=1 Tax=Tetrapyrgos nigripes TaxID=182062 RepID=A0A8H5FLP8_9AGAR|nr:hypothetical protein D9758_012306 [Tetrapyrgos nigripes]